MKSTPEYPLVHVVLIKSLSAGRTAIETLAVCLQSMQAWNILTSCCHPLSLLQVGPPQSHELGCFRPGLSCLASSRRLWESLRHCSNQTSNRNVLSPYEQPNNIFQNIKEKNNELNKSDAFKSFKLVAEIRFFMFVLSFLQF